MLYKRSSDPSHTFLLQLTLNMCQAQKAIYIIMWQEALLDIQQLSGFLSA